MKKLLATSAIALALATTGGGDAKAQAIDYGSLKELFGQPVTTSANGSPQKESEVPLNMEIITQEDIKRSGARTIPEALRFLPGVSVRRQNFNQYEVGIRGYNQANSERILVLVNGRQVYLDYFGLVDWGGIPVEMAEIQQIELVKGPNTALFGFNAVSGVINIITYNPLYEDVGELQVRAGTNSLTEASVVKTFKFGDKVATKLSAGGYEAEEMDDWETEYPAINDEPERRSVSMDTWWQVTDNIQAQFEATMSRNVRNEIIVSSRSQSSNEYDSSSVRGRVIADTDYGLIEADVYHNEIRTHFDLLLDQTTGAIQPFEIDNRITVAKLNNTFKWGTDHTFRVGGEFRDSTSILDTADQSLSNGSDQLGRTWSVSGLWDWAINDKWNSSTAVRFDGFELNNDGAVSGVVDSPLGTVFDEDDLDGQRRNEVSYNLGLVYEANDRDTYRLTHSRGADLPSYIEFSVPFIAGGPDGIIGLDPLSLPNLLDNVLTVGDPDVNTSIVNNVELGYTRQIDRIDGQLSTAVFYQHSDDMQAFNADIYGYGVITNAGQVNQIGNIGDSEAWGVEIGLDGTYRKNLDWAVNYSYISIDDDFRNFGNDPRDTTVFNSSFNYEDSVANHRINAHLGYTWEDWRFDVMGQYINSSTFLTERPGSGNAGFEETDVNDQFIANANIAYDVADNLTWSVSGTSITGPTQQFPDNDVATTVFTTLGIKF